jgi:hypothetical protein
VNYLSDTLHDIVDSHACENSIVERKCSTVNSIVGRKRPTVTFSDSVCMYDVGVERGTVAPVHPNTEDHRVDSVIFSAEVYNHCEGFSDRHVLLDTCAGESVFKCRDLYFVELSATPMIISGVNPKGNPLVINECGETDFGFVYYDPKCIANILSFGNVVNTSESVTYNSRHDCYVVQVKPGGVCYRFSRDPVS